MRGANDSRFCTECLPHTCHGNGDCTINPVSFAADCHCYTGYSSKYCQVNLAGILASVALSVVLIAVLGYATVRFFRRRVKYAQLSSELHQRLLEESKFELNEMERAWEIDPKDVKLTTAVASGGFGDVWRAEWHDMEVAVKRLKKSIRLLDESSFQAFMDEAKLQRSLRHRNVVLFYGVGVFEDDSPFLITEFMAKGSLRDLLLGSEDLPWAQRVGFAKDAANGLGFLHSRTPPRMHRDIKSDNLLVNARYTVKVADFGTSRMLLDMSKSDADEESDAGMSASKPRRVARFPLAGRRQSPMSSSLPSSAGGVTFEDATMDGESEGESRETTRHMTRNVGTLVWSAPEVLEGQTYNLSADVYSFGVVLWEIWSRRTPFEEDNSSVFKLRQKIVDGERPSLAVQEITPEQQDFIELTQRCWHAIPAERPTFAEAIEVLEAMDA